MPIGNADDFVVVVGYDIVSVEAVVAGATVDDGVVAELVDQIGLAYFGGFDGFA